MLKRLFQRKPRQTHRLTVRPLGADLEVSERTTLLDAALDAELPFPHSCCAGECGSCLCRLVSGQVSEEMDTSHLISAAQRQAGYILACQSLPRSDVTVEIPALPVHPLIQTTGRVSSVRPLTHDILQLEVALEAPMAYTAGQYAELAVPDVVEEGRNYSFATAPRGEAQSTVTFHVRHVPGGAFTDWLHGADRTGTALRVTGPHGQFALRQASGTILCVAGGSGMAPIKALLEQALHDGVRRDVVFYFGARQQRDLYCLQEMEALRAAWPAAFEFVPILSEEPAGSDWTGRRGLVTEGLEDLGERWADCQAYLCGPPPMIDAAVARMERGGLTADHIFFDKFTDKSHLAAVV